MTTTLLQTLLNAGIISNDATVLDEHFANCDSKHFLDGMELISRALAANEPPGLLPPATEPWLTIYQKMQQLGDLDQAFNDAISSLDTMVQIAIQGAVNVRVNEIRQWLQSNQMQSKRRKTAQYIKALENLGYRFTYNLCTQETEVNGKPLSDNDAKVIRTQLRDIGIFEINIAEDAYQAEAWKNKYHPIKDYLSSLSFQGGDPISELATFFNDDYGMFPIWLKRWLIGSVARVFANVQNRVWILDGPQDIGKSHFVKWLCSPEPAYYHEGAINPDDKDNRLRRMSTWIWEVNEFGSTSRRADREALKAFITTHMVRERKPYGRYDIIGPAIVSFIGTVNNEMGILNDPTGNRRFMISSVSSIDWDYTKLDIDQIWAQAYDLYIAGEPWDLTKDEKKTANEINDQFQMLDIVEETIKKHFDIEPDNENLWMAVTEIMDILKDPMQGNLKVGSEIDTRRVAAALTKLGLGKSKTRKLSGVVARGYYGIKRTCRLLP